MKPTKKPVASCKVPAGRKPSREKYDALRDLVNPLIRKAKAKAKRASMRAGSIVPVPDPKPPHTMPPYGGPCWIQSYREAQAYIRACQKTAELRQALIEYDSAWYAMEYCLNGTPA